jgi:hypothetical protein
MTYDPEVPTTPATLLGPDKHLVTPGFITGCAIGFCTAFDLRAFILTFVLTTCYFGLLFAFYKSVSGYTVYSFLHRHPTATRGFVFTFPFFIAAIMVGITARTINLFVYQLPGEYMNWLAVGVLPIGYGAHYFRTRNLRVYGMSEILLGVSTAFGVTIRPHFQPTQALTLIGATYVVARGFNNVAEARLKATSGVEPSAPAAVGTA